MSNISPDKGNIAMFLPEEENIVQNIVENEIFFIVGLLKTPSYPCNAYIYLWTLSWEWHYTYSLCLGYDVKLKKALSHFCLRV